MLTSFIGNQFNASSGFDSFLARLSHISISINNINTIKKSALTSTALLKGVDVTPHNNSNNNTAY